ncbi:hypothetical protein ACIXOF_16625 [Bacteroides fragilis]
MELHVEAFWSVDGNGYRKYPKVGESVGVFQSNRGLPMLYEGGCHGSH